MFTKLKSLIDDTDQSISGNFTTGYPQEIANWIADTIFPVQCIGCGLFSPPKKKEYICKKCLRNIGIRNNFECIGCKKSTLLGQTCPACRKKNFLDQLLIVLDYKKPTVIKLIKLLKYRFVKEATNPIFLAAKKYIVWLAKNKQFNILDENPIITFVPLHYQRTNWRGFNQAELIAESIGQILQQDISTGILVRNSRSKPQAEIENREERLRRPTGLFDLVDDSAIKNRTVILIDDICTTGATLNECARIMKTGGAKKIIGFVIARG